MKVRDRLVAAGVALLAVSVLVVGATLTPTRAGIGSHTQLGFPACEFERRVGIPCLSCGYTTSVSHFSHGNFLASLYLQPMGFVIAALCAVTFWVGTYAAATGRPVHRLVGRVATRGWFIGLLAIMILAWGWKIWLRLTGRDVWPPF